MVSNAELELDHVADLSDDVVRGEGESVGRAGNPNHMDLDISLGEGSRGVERRSSKSDLRELHDEVGFE